MRDVGFAAVLLAAVLTTCIPGPSSGQAGTGGGRAPERHEGAAARLAAALEDQAAEQDRLEAAKRYRSGAGGGVRVHTVSMAEPVPPGDFVDAVAAAGLSVKSVHVWLQSPGSDEIGTGIVESDTGAPAADDPAFVGHLETVFGDSLVGDRQLAVFGFVCSCAVSQLDAFEAHLGRGAVRAVEVHGNAGRMPIWPRDPVRDAIIESGGTYGR